MLYYGMNLLLMLLAISAHRLVANLVGELVRKSKSSLVSTINTVLLTAIGVSIKEVNNSEEITIGKAMQNCRLYILDTIICPSGRRRREL